MIVSCRMVVRGVQETGAAVADDEGHQACNQCAVMRMLKRRSALRDIRYVSAAPSCCMLQTTTADERIAFHIEVIGLVSPRRRRALLLECVSSTRSSSGHDQMINPPPASGAPHTVNKIIHSGFRIGKGREASRGEDAAPPQ